MIFVAPQSHKKLILNNNELVSIDGKESYSVIKGVPVLLPEKTNPDWSRELIEIIFWEHPYAIPKIYEEIEKDNIADWNEIYIKYIKEIHGTKEAVLLLLETLWFSHCLKEQKKFLFYIEKTFYRYTFTN